ncbi:hypothetical protein M0802_001709 [Mischocyttarus mexicanus]|nr:hypothetical protein M0802_001709 [Mischocyttarus mexicanus]
MLEQFCAKGQRSLIVQKLKKKRQKSKKHKSVSRKEKAPAPSLEDRWDDLAPELSTVMQGFTIPEMIPFDATLDIPVDDQKSDAMKRIQKLLRIKAYEKAVGLLRACRTPTSYLRNYSNIAVSFCRKVTRLMEQQLSYFVEIPSVE